MEFHQTGYGKDFFGRQLPALIRALEKLADSIQKKPLAQPLPIQIEARANLLQDFFKGYYDPGSEIAAAKSQQYQKMAGELREIEDTLRRRISPEDWNLAERYGQILVDRAGVELEMAFEGGYRCAMQLLIAGLTSPKEGQSDEM